MPVLGADGGRVKSCHLLLFLQLHRPPHPRPPPGIMTSEKGGGRPDKLWRENVDEKKSEGFFFHVLSTKLCLTFEFSPRLTSIKSCQITLKGLELPGETFACHVTGFLYCSRHEKIRRRKVWKGVTESWLRSSVTTVFLLVRDSLCN